MPPAHFGEFRTPGGRVVWVNKNGRARGREGGRVRHYVAWDPTTRRRLGDGGCRRDLLASIDRNHPWIEPSAP